MADQEIIVKVRELQGKDFSLKEEIEMQDVVNNNDEIIASLPREVIWDNGLENYVRVVNIFAVDELDRVLLHVRALDKKKWPGGFDFSCGENIKSGESYEEGVRRGMKEELGIVDFEWEEKGKFYPDKNAGFNCFGKVYEVRISKETEFKINKREVLEVRWEKKEVIRDILEKYPEKFKPDYRAVFEEAFGKR